jgi:hypothetical protein
MLRAIEAAPASKRPEKRRLLNMAAIAEDLPLDLEATLDDAAHSGGTGLTADADQPSIAEIYLQMHDPVSAARYMAASNPADPLAKAIGLLMPGYGALERNDAAAAVPPLEAFWHAWLADPDLQSSLADEQCNVGLAYGLAGRMADAEAVFKRAGPWNRCYADHGDVRQAGLGRGPTRGARSGACLCASRAVGVEPRRPRRGRHRFRRRA